MEWLGCDRGHVCAVTAVAATVSVSGSVALDDGCRCEDERVGLLVVIGTHSLLL